MEKRGGWAAGYHTGIDYRASVGTPIYATKGGVVVHTGWGGWGNAYGNHVIIESPDHGQRVRSIYAHLNTHAVSKGRVIRAGDLVGRAGATGNVTGPHLHYEERVSPFGYYNHRNPKFPAFIPKRFLKRRITLANVLAGRPKAVTRVQKELNRKSNANLEITGKWDEATKKAYINWQKKLGFDGKDADGRPGVTSLQRLGFFVKA